MLNFCVFTFILYAVGGSVKTILFGNVTLLTIRADRIAIY